MRLTDHELRTVAMTSGTYHIDMLRALWSLMLERPLSREDVYDGLNRLCTEGKEPLDSTVEPRL